MTRTAVTFEGAVDGSLKKQLNDNFIDIYRKATISLAAGGSANECDATITFTDDDGTAVSGIHRVEVYISEDSAGDGLTADSTGTLVAATGTVLTELTDDKHIIAVTDSSGQLVLTLTDTNDPADQYFVVVSPNGSLTVSEASGTSWGS